jgi:hypothetical protein
MVNGVAIERTTCEYKIPMILVLLEHYSSIGLQRYNQAKK